MSTPQELLSSSFGAASTAEEVIRNIDLTGKTAIVTGGYSGIGLITAKALARAGARVIVPARDQTKARETLRPYPELILESLDLMAPSSVDAFADRFLSSDQPLHILINNAGIMAPPLVRDSRGYESQFSTNHLGNFQLTTRLWPALLKANGARVVSVSSRGHVRSPFDFEDWNFEKRNYETWTAYGESKSANALFAVKLDELGKKHNVRAFSLHPGGIITDLVRYMKAEDLEKAGAIDGNGNPIIDPENNMKTPDQGAATNIWCATSPQLNGMGGVYCENCNIAVAVAADSKTLLGVRPWAVDPDSANRLWSLSQTLTGTSI